MAFRIYTRTGDEGSTALIGGTRVLKNHIRIEAYGTVDELNSWLGVISAQSLAADSCQGQLLAIQDRLFTLGSQLAVDPDGNNKMKLPELSAEDIVQLESWIDEMEEKLPELKSFVLPGGDQVSSFCHVARCVCRRAERICVAMQEQGAEIPLDAVRYLNRLSDYLFVLSRFLLLENGGLDRAWKPKM